MVSLLSYAGPSTNATSYDLTAQLFTRTRPSNARTHTTSHTPISITDTVVNLGWYSFFNPAHIPPHSPAALPIRIVLIRQPLSNALSSMSTNIPTSLRDWALPPALHLLSALDRVATLAFQAFCVGRHLSLRVHSLPGGIGGIWFCTAPAAWPLSAHIVGDALCSIRCRAGIRVW